MKNRNARKKKYLYKKNRFCFYCGTETLLDVDQNDPKFATLDHVKPKSRGGISHLDNYVIACRKCNKLKGSKLAKTFKRELRKEKLNDHRTTV